MIDVEHHRLRALEQDALAGAAQRVQPFPDRLDERQQPRRCGWFDAAMVRQAVKVGAIQGLALTKLDVLDGFSELRVCTGYQVQGREMRHLPAAPGAQAAAQPIYETLEGWRDSTRGARSWADLPAQAIKYVRRIEELIGCSAVLLSTSPEREDTILMQNPFET